MVAFGGKLLPVRFKDLASTNYSLPDQTCPQSIEYQTPIAFSILICIYHCRPSFQTINDSFFILNKSIDHRVVHFRSYRSNLASNLIPIGQNIAIKVIHCSFPMRLNPPQPIWPLVQVRAAYTLAIWQQVRNILPTSYPPIFESNVHTYKERMEEKRLILIGQEVSLSK